MAAANKTAEKSKPANGSATAAPWSREDEIRA
jgi:hypothetical protein